MKQIIPPMSFCMPQFRFSIEQLIIKKVEKKEHTVKSVLRGGHHVCTVNMATKTRGSICYKLPKTLRPCGLKTEGDTSHLMGLS